jgi:glycerate 2-kinase
MKIVLAPDSFKGSLSALEVCRAMAEGIGRVLSGVEVVAVPMADGGEGTVRSLVDATEGRIVHKSVTGPLGKKVEAFFGVLGNGKTAVIEMAAASGLPLVAVEKRNPGLTTTYGTGELILAALEEGCGKLIVGIGGSATNDGGAGMARALGVRFLDRDGRELRPGGAALRDLDRIDCSGKDERLDGVEVIVACDVTNPLTGPDGASMVYGPQKGATREMALELDWALEHFAGVIRKDLGLSVGDRPGTGAAGGLGAGLIVFLGGALKPGVDIVSEAVGLREKMKDADLVLTGEGRIDGQTVRGKTPIGVAKIAKSLGLPVLAIAGGLGPGAELVFRQGIDGIMPIVDGPMTLEEAITGAEELVAGAVERMLRIYLGNCQLTP